MFSEGSAKKGLRGIFISVWGLLFFWHQIGHTSTISIGSTLKGGDPMATKDFKRKLTAILSADVEGYSGLMGEDEVATVRNPKIVQTESQDDCVCSDISP